MAEAEEVAQGKSLKPDNLYELAWVCAAAVLAAQKEATLTLEERAQLVERYTASGVDLLLRGERAGLFKEAERIEKLKTDRFLEPLRPSADFQKLLQRVQAMEVPKEK
jgi:hypothetical protein